MQGLVDNKKEYTKYLQDSLTIPIAEKIKNYYDLSLENKSGLKGFQKELNKIKEWNNNYIDTICSEILKKSKYKNLDKLYKYVIITSVKIKIYEYKDQIEDVNIKYLSMQDYIHKCFINIATWAWKNPFLFFKQNIRETEIQNNYNIIEKNIRKIIKNTLMECIPIDSIIEQIEEKNKNNTNINQFVESNTTDDNNDDIDLIQLNEDNNKNEIINNKINNNETFTSSLLSAITRNTSKLNRFLTKSNDNINNDLEKKKEEEKLNEYNEIISDADSEYNKEDDNNKNDIENDIKNHENDIENDIENDENDKNDIENDENDENDENNENDENDITVTDMDKIREKYNNMNSDSESNNSSDNNLDNKKFLSDNSYDTSSSLSDSDNEYTVKVKKMY